MVFKRIQLANNPVSKTLIWVVLAAFLFSTACTTTTAVMKSHRSAVKSEVTKGYQTKIVTTNSSDAIITTKDGSTFEFRIVDASSEAIMGYKLGNQLHGAPQQTILFSDIASLHQFKGPKKPKSKTEKTLLVIGGVLLVLLFVLLYIGLKQLEDEFNNK